MYIFDPELGIEQGHVVSMHVGPSVNPYFEAFTTFLQLNNDQTGVSAAEWELREKS